MLLGFASRLLTENKEYFRLPEFAGCFSAGRSSTGMHASVKMPRICGGSPRFGRHGSTQQEDDVQRASSRLIQL